MQKEVTTPIAEETPVASVETGMEEGQDIRGKIIEIIKKFSPDSDTENEENFLQSVYSGLSILSNLHDKLLQVVEEFPEFGDALSAILKGMSPDEAIARYFDPENLTPPEDAPDFEKISMAKTERRKQIEAVNARKSQLLENEQVSVENVKAVMEELGISNEEGQKFLDDITSLQNDLFDGLLSPDHIRVLWKGFAYDPMLAEKDKEIEMAAEDGKIAGRNEQIIKKRIGKDSGDGVPKLGNTGGDSKIPPVKAPIIKEPFRV